MPLTHTRIFRIRYYECDAHGHLNNATYLRYMQETAFDASAAAGYDEKEYQEMGRRWLIRQTEIDYLLPVKYNDHLQVKTWVADFRRASSRRAYEFTNLETGTVIARAYTDWVFLDAETMQPVTIPETLINAFYPEGVPNSFPSRKKLPAQPEPNEDVFSITRAVDWLDIDQMKHVNNAMYMDYVTECGMQVLNAYGWSWERMLNSGFAIYLRSNQIQYLQPALLGDELEISTWISNVRRSTATRHYRIRRKNDGAMIAKVNSFSVWVDVKNQRPMRIPPQFITDFEPNIA